MIKSLIFDMDGTLFQTGKILEPALEETFDHLRALGKWEGITPIEGYRRIMGAPLPRVWETLMPNHSEEERRETDEYFLDTLIEYITSGKAALYPHVEELFSYLKENGYSLYIASNGLRAYLDAIVGYFHLDRWVSEVFSIQDLQSLNKSALVKAVLDKYDIHQAAVVGDRLSDINAAKENNLLAIGCNFDFAVEEELAQADFVVNDLLELKEILAKI